MCGIAAIYNLNENIANNDLLIEKMMDEVRDRGPDAYDIYQNNKVTFGHRRLSIIDLDQKANQPFYWKDKYVLIFNGAIYNYKELKLELESLGYIFNTNSDTEVLIASYEEWGSDCLKKFNGMWAFLIYDKKHQSIFASRDRFGIKPLYFGRIKNKLFFASEIKQLRAVGLGAEANLQEISKFIYTGCIDTTSETCFKGIKSIMPGHNLLIQKDKFNLSKWYFFNDCAANYVNNKDLLELLKDAINIRTRGDVKIGSLLSGGIDSSLITVNLNNILKKQKQSFYIFHGSSQDKETNETYYAKLVSDSMKKELLIKKPTSRDFWENVEKICYLQDEPFGSTSIFMQYFVMQDVKNKGCKILLDGQGADEIALGYKRYLSLPIYQSIKDKNLIQFIKDLFNIFTRNNNLNFITKSQYIFGPLLFPVRILRTFLRLDFVKLSLLDSKLIYKTISKSLWNSQELQKLEIFNFSLPSLLRFADRNSMHNSIELRLPYLDHRFVEAIVKKPLKFKIRNGWDKFLLRNSDLLPKEIAWRQSKLGFASPARSWTKQYSQEMLDQVMDSQFTSKLFSKKRLFKKWKKLNENEKWRIFNIAIWAKSMRIK